MNRNSNQMRHEPRLYVYIRALVRVGGEKKRKKKRGEKERRRRRKRDVEDRLNVEREPGEKYNDFAFKSV